MMENSDLTPSMNEKRNVEKHNIDYMEGVSYNGDRIPGTEDVKTSVETKLESLLTIQEISELLKVPKSYVYSLTHQKKIPHMKIQGHLRFRRAHIDEWLRSQEVSDVCIQEEARKRN